MFWCVWMCLGEKLEREERERICPKTAQEIFFFFFGGKMSGLEAFIAKNDLSATGAPCRVASHLVDIGNFGLVSVQI